MTVSERVAAFALRYYLRHQRWPTIAVTAEALGLRRSTIEDCEGDGDYQFVGFSSIPTLVEATAHG